MKKKRTDRLRLTLQIAVFLLVLLIVVSKELPALGLALPLLPDASLHAICPFGGVVTVYDFITAGTFIQKIHSSAFILMLLGLLTALFFGPIFCSHFCPFGSFQEWIGKLGKKLFPKRYNNLIPPQLDRALRYLRYVVLILVVYQTAATARLIFQEVDPYYALMNFFTNEVAVSAYVILGAVALASLFIERPWCKYLCPYGALLGLFNPFRLFKIRRNKSTCVSCGKCDSVCPMNIPVSAKETVRNHQCISCYRCTSDSSCPIGDTITISVTKKGGAK